MSVGPRQAATRLHGGRIGAQEDEPGAPPGLPAGEVPRSRPGPVRMSLMAPQGAHDLAAELLRFCRTAGNATNLRDLRYYGAHGRSWPAPTPLHLLPPETRAKVDRMVSRVNPRPGECYRNCLLAAAGEGGVAYCEGVYADLRVPFPRQHAWLHVDGHTVDPTSQVAIPEALGDGAAYFGVAIPIDEALEVLIEEGRARPVALGPPRPAHQRAIEEAAFE